MNKAQKLVKILELMTRTGGVRALDLMDRFDLDSRTLRRYLADLRDLDLPIVDDGRGEDRVVSIEARWRRTGVQLSLAEVLSLHFGRTLFDFLDGTSFAEDLDGALERLSPAIKRTHFDLARQLDTKFLAVQQGIKDYRGDKSDIIDDVISALVYNNALDARYRKANGVEKGYTLYPYTLAVFRQGLYIFAFDVDGGLVKTFAVERFTDVTRLRTERFESPPGWKPQAYLADAFGIISGPPVDVVLAFSESVAAYIRERTWHPTQTFRSLPDGRLELRMRVAHTVELRTWVLGFGRDVEALEPATLVEQVAASLRDAAAQYGKPTC